MVYVPRPENEMGMSSGSQEKRAREGNGNGSSPKLARSSAPPPTDEGGQQQGRGIPVKSKIDEEAIELARLTTELNILLSSAINYSEDDVRSKFSNKYPAVRMIDTGSGSVSVDKASRKVLVNEYLRRIKTKSALQSEIRDVKAEIRTRGEASSSASATVSSAPGYASMSVAELKTELETILDDEIFEEDLKKLFMAKFKLGDIVQLEGYAKPISLRRAVKMQVIKDWISRERTHKDLVDTIMAVKKFISTGKNPFTAVSDPPLISSSSSSVPKPAAAYEKKKK
jgi:hypothetical protein